MLELKGKYGDAKVFTDNIDQETISQVIGLLNQPYAAESKIRIMPDCHAGSGCVIGTTMTLADKVVPNLVGVDIGCGMYALQLEETDIDLSLLDAAISQYVPAGFNIHEHPIIAIQILQAMDLHVTDSFQTVHNYIDTKNRILRKGSISAQSGEKVLIPLNMRDGSLICIGQGNPDWNYSAPHGAGRILSRSKAKDDVSMDDFKDSMSGIYSTSVTESTIDESPFVYKPMDEIMGNIKDTVEIVERITPIYNFKAH